MKAENLKGGHVLVDPEGHLYEVVSVTHQGVKIHAWLWPDSSPVPNYFQTFSPDEDIIGINGHSPECNAANEETAVIPRVEGANNGTVPDGVAE